MRILLTIALSMFWAIPSTSWASVNSCLLTTAIIEQREKLPRGLLYAIALTESGRWNAADRSSYAWPWTIRAKEDAFVVDSKNEAMAIVSRLKASGRKNIDVGCMQINLKYHPHAFDSLAAAFEPKANIGYAARFLKKLRVEGRSWQKAIEWYHSRDPERGRDYRKKVYKHWQTAQIAINRAHQALARAGRSQPTSGTPALEISVKPSHGAVSGQASIVEQSNGVLVVRARKPRTEPIQALVDRNHSQTRQNRGGIAPIYEDLATVGKPADRALHGIDVVRGSRAPPSFFVQLR